MMTVTIMTIKLCTWKTLLGGFDVPRSHVLQEQVSWGSCQLLGGLDDGVGNSPKRGLAGWAGAYHKSDYDDDQYDDYNDYGDDIDDDKSDDIDDDGDKPVGD